MSQHIAIYLRISKADARDLADPTRAGASTSIEKQRRSCRRVAAERWPDRPVVEYVDQGFSASKGRVRPGLMSLLAAVESGAVAAVVVDTVDRLTRDRGASSFWDVATACERAGAEFVGASQDIEVSTAGGELSASVLAAAARFEARRTADRVKATNRLRASQGLRALGGPALWGMARDDRGAFVLDHRPIEVEGSTTTRAALLLDVVDRVIEGRLSVRGLAEEFTRRGIPTARGHAVWSHRAASKLLRSPALAGMVPSTEAGGVLRDPDSGLPVVTPGAPLSVKCWDMLQAAIDERARTRVAASPRRPPTLLHGLVVDDEGHRLYRFAKAGKPLRYYCNVVGCPTKSSIDLAALDAYVIAEFVALFGAIPETVSRLVVEPVNVGRLAAVRREIESTGRAIAMERDRDKRDALSDRLDALYRTEAEVERAGARGGIATPMPTGRTLAEALAAATDDAGRRAVLDLGLRSVVVHPGRRGGPAVPVAERVSLAWHDVE